MVLCTGLLVGCDKNEEYESVKPPIEQPEEPIKPEEPDKPVVLPSTNDIVKTKIGDNDMIIGSKNWNAIAYGNGKYVTVGNNGFVTSSSDGVNWETPKTVGNSTWQDVKYINGKYMAVGGANMANGARIGELMTSTDGINWIGPTYISSRNNYTYSITYGNGKYVATGYPASVSTSTDGTNWKTFQLGGSPIFCSVIFVGDKFVIVDSYGGMRISLDGDTFTYVDAKGIELRDIAYGNGKFVAVGKAICVSDDRGETWINQNIPGGCTYQTIVFNNGKFMTTGEAGYYMISEDGVNWTTPEQIKDESGKVVTADLNGICAMP